MVSSETRTPKEERRTRTLPSPMTLPNVLRLTRPKILDRLQIGGSILDAQCGLTEADCDDVEKGSAIRVSHSLTPWRQFRSSPVFVPLITVIEIVVYMYQASSTFHHSSMSPKACPQLIAPFNELDVPQSLQRVASTATIGSSLLVYRRDKRNEVWRYVMYMFVHVGWQHLLLNTSIQLMAGIPLEFIHGTIKTGFIYLTGVLAGSLATDVLGADAILVGSSSGVYALVAAHLPSNILNYSQKNDEFGKLKLFTVCFVVFGEIGLTAWSWREDQQSSVSYTAHLTGTIAGLVTGSTLLGPYAKYEYQHTTSATCRLD